jgi:hypothetical protein
MLSPPVVRLPSSTSFWLDNSAAAQIKVSLFCNIWMSLGGTLSGLRVGWLFVQHPSAPAGSCAGAVAFLRCGSKAEGTEIERAEYGDRCGGASWPCAFPPPTGDSRWLKFVVSASLIYNILHPKSGNSPAESVSSEGMYTALRPSIDSSPKRKSERPQPSRAPLYSPSFSSQSQPSQIRPFPSSSSRMPSPSRKPRPNSSPKGVRIVPLSTPAPTILPHHLLHLVPGLLGLGLLSRALGLVLGLGRPLVHVAHRPSAAAEADAGVGLLGPVALLRRGLVRHRRRRRRRRRCGGGGVASC